VGFIIILIEFIHGGIFLNALKAIGFEFPPRVNAIVRAVGIDKGPNLVSYGRLKLRITKLINLMVVHFQR
jgi:hypothetical protein